jgi:hypothetical protein
VPQHDVQVSIGRLNKFLDRLLVLRQAPSCIALGRETMNSCGDIPTRAFSFEVDQEPFQQGYMPDGNRCEGPMTRPS